MGKQRSYNYCISYYFGSCFWMIHFPLSHRVPKTIINIPFLSFHGLLLCLATLIMPLKGKIKCLLYFLILIRTCICYRYSSGNWENKRNKERWREFSDEIQFQPFTSRNGSWPLNKIMPVTLYKTLFSLIKSEKNV